MDTITKDELMDLWVALAKKPIAQSFIGGFGTHSLSVGEIKIQLSCSNNQFKAQSQSLWFRGLNFDLTEQEATYLLDEFSKRKLISFNQVKKYIDAFN